jgi:hypothetical protein
MKRLMVAVLLSLAVIAGAQVIDNYRFQYALPSKSTAYAVKVYGVPTDAGLIVTTVVYDVTGRPIYASSCR